MLHNQLDTAAVISDQLFAIAAVSILGGNWPSLASQLPASPCVDAYTTSELNCKSSMKAVLEPLPKV